MKKKPCRYCGKSSGVIKFYIIADNLEEPRPYHKGCIKKLYFDVLKQLWGITTKE
jgi:hypothetical protein